MFRAGALPGLLSVTAVSSQHREFNLFAFTLTPSNRAYYKRDVPPRDTGAVEKGEW
jgi:hypothetical protein